MYILQYFKFDIDKTKEYAIKQPIKPINSTQSDLISKYKELDDKAKDYGTNLEEIIKMLIISSELPANRTTIDDFFLHCIQTNNIYRFPHIVHMTDIGNICYMHNITSIRYLDIFQINLLEDDKGLYKNINNLLQKFNIN